MTPPGTKFFMKAAGLGKMHKEIEAQKMSQMGRGGNIGSRDRYPLENGQSSKTQSPSRSVRGDRQTKKGAPPPSREIIGNTDGPVRFPRVHRKYLSWETLDEYEISWTYSFEINDHIVIREYLTQHELDLLRQHTVWVREGRKPDMARQRTEWVREGKNLDAALRKAKKEIAQRKELSESRERQERKERSDTGRKPERRCEREAEWTSVPKRGNRNHDGGHADVPQPEEQVRENKAQNRPAPVPKKVTIAKPVPEQPSPPQCKSHHSPVPSMSCRLDGPFTLHEYPSTEQPRQCPPQTPRSPSRSRMSQPPVELPATPPRRAREQAEKKPKHPPPTVLPATPPRRAREPAEKKPKPPTVQQVPKPHEGTPSTSTASRHVPAPSKHTRFRSPPHSESPPTVLQISRPSKALPGAFPSSEE